MKRNKNDWRERLVSVFEESGISYRYISLRAGLGPGYVFSILKEGKEPTVSNLRAVCEALDVSPAYIILGVRLDPEDEELLYLVQSAPPEAREAVLNLLRAMTTKT